jgi:hypothetical protein
MRGADVSETFKNARRNRRVNQILDWFVFLFNLVPLKQQEGIKEKIGIYFLTFVWGGGLGLGDFVILICFV